MWEQIDCGGFGRGLVEMQRGALLSLVRGHYWVTFGPHDGGHHVWAKDEADAVSTLSGKDITVPAEDLAWLRGEK